MASLQGLSEGLSRGLGPILQHLQGRDQEKRYNAQRAMEFFQQLQAQKQEREQDNLDDINNELSQRGALDQAGPQKRPFGPGQDSKTPPYTEAMTLQERRMLVSNLNKEDRENQIIKKQQEDALDQAEKEAKAAQQTFENKLKLDKFGLETLDTKSQIGDRATDNALAAQIAQTQKEDIQRDNRRADAEQGRRSNETEAERLKAAQEASSNEFFVKLQAALIKKYPAVASIKNNEITALGEIARVDRVLTKHPRFATEDIKFSELKDVDSTLAALIQKGLPGIDLDNFRISLDLLLEAMNLTPGVAEVIRDGLGL